MPVSVASDVSFHVVPSSCKVDEVGDVIVAFGEGVTLLVHPAAAAVASNNVPISTTRKPFFIRSSSPRFEYRAVTDTHDVAYCLY